MKYFGYTLNLRDDAQAIAAYKEYHRNVWPEIEAMQRRLGVTKIRIFLHGRRLFLYLETSDDYDPVKAGPEYMKDPRIVEWERTMQDKFQEPLPEAKPGEWWLPMEAIYELDYRADPEH
jgi:L-rhamnose mutarotase